MGQETLPTYFVKIPTNLKKVGGGGVVTPPHPPARHSLAYHRGAHNKFFSNPLSLKILMRNTLTPNPKAAALFNKSSSTLSFRKTLLRIPRNSTTTSHTHKNTYTNTHASTHTHTHTHTHTQRIKPGLLPWQSDTLLIHHSIAVLYKYKQCKYYLLYY